MLNQWTIPALLLIAGGVEAQVAFDGPPGGVGGIVELGNVDLRPPQLQGVRLLPLDCVGRCSSTLLLADRAQRVDDIPGASRLLLPGVNGSLYRYRRDAAGRSHFGLFQVVAGQALPVFERDGWGPGDSRDPFLEKIATSTTGTSILIASVYPAGGDLWEVDLRSGSVIARTQGIPPRSFRRNGLALLADWGFALSQEGPLRFRRSSPDRAESVPMSPACTWFGQDVVMSQDQSTVAFVAGDSPSQAHVYVCRSYGAAERVTQVPDAIVGAGFLPEERNGPTMALSTDGSSVAWLTENAYSRECWVAETQGSPAVQVTSDVRFDDTLNDAGVISFFDPDSLVILVGEGLEIGEGDLYRIDAGSGLSVTNLTGTSGITLPPHDYGTIVAEDGIFQLPGGAGWLILDSRDNEDTTGDTPGRLLRVDVSGTVHVLLQDAEVLERVERGGRYVAAVVRRTVGADLPGVAFQNVVQVALDGSEVQRLVVGQGIRITRTLGSRVHDRLAVVADLEAGEWLGQIRLPSASGFVVSSQVLRFGPSIGQDAAGSLYTTLAVTSLNAFFAWTDLGVLPIRVMPGFVLPGE